MQQLNDAELSATLTALADYRVQTQHYLRGYEGPELSHDACCGTARMREIARKEARDALNQQLRVIDGAIMALEAD